MIQHRHQYESAASTQTLEQGLAEYLECNPHLKRRESLHSEQARQFFHSHDVVHVLYGCSTAVADEAVVKLSSILGTTGGLSILRGYAHHESQDIYRELPVWETLRTVLTAPFIVPRTIWRCARQRQRWPWVDHAHLLNVPLAQLRAQFGIRVLHRG